MKKGFAVLLGLWGTWVAAAMAAEPAAPGFFQKQGIKVISTQKGPGGLTVWKVEKEGARTVFYTTGDSKVLMSGVLWDAATGANLSDAFLTPDVTGQGAGAFSPDKVPDAIKGIETLTGVREGKGGPDRTLYVMFDPRCPHCHAAYAKLRAWVASGGTVKWIPVTVLGRTDAAARQVADIMQASNPLSTLGAAMSGRASAGSLAPSPATLKTIQENEAYFWAAFDRNKSAGTAGVPVAFFMTRQGVPQMLAGVDDDRVLQQILGELKK